MQYSTLISAASMIALTTAAALPSDFPTLGGPEWYDWSATVSASSASSAVAVAAVSETQTAWGQWTPAEATTAPAATSWAQWSPSTPAAAQATSSSSSVPYENPFTIYTTMTNQWGVITGMPSVVTSQPSVVTSQPSVVTSQPAAETSVTTNAPVPVSQNSTTMVTTSITPTSSQGFTQTSPAVQHTGAASNVKVSGMGFAVMVLGCGVAML